MTEQARARVILTAVVEYDLPDLPSDGYGDASTASEAVAVDVRMANDDPIEFLTVLASDAQWQSAIGYVIGNKGD